MAEPSADVREGMRTIIADALLAAHASLDAEYRRDDAAVAAAPSVAEDLERAVLAESRAGSIAYAAITKSLTHRLLEQHGDFPDEIYGAELLFRRVPAEGLVKTVAAALRPPSDDEPEAPASVPAPDSGPRTTLVRRMVRTLLLHDYYAADRPLTLKTARELETSCYNAAIHISKQSEEPPRRGWDSQAFVDIYSQRCGSILALLDPAGIPCVSYGASVAARLFSGELTPSAVGRMSERDLCPEATEAERAEIGRRSAQKVEEKESNLFRCPHCGERRCTYQQVQRRSLDEAPDYLCVCVNPACRKRFTGRS